MFEREAAQKKEQTKKVLFNLRVRFAKNIGAMHLTHVNFIALWTPSLLHRRDHLLEKARDSKFFKMSSNVRLPFSKRRRKRKLVSFGLWENFKKSCQLFHCSTTTITTNTAITTYTATNASSFVNTKCRSSIFMGLVIAELLSLYIFTWFWIFSILRKLFGVGNWVHEHEGSDDNIHGCRSVMWEREK